MVLVLSGPVHGGKTAFLEKTVPQWIARGLACDGFLSLASADADHEKVYDLFELKTGRRQPYLRRRGVSGAERTGPFAFVPSALERARSIIRGADPLELLVVDEIGPLELGGGGLWPALREILAEPERRVLLVARREILGGLAAALAPAAPLVFDIGDPECLRILDERVMAGARIS